MQRRSRSPGHHLYPRAQLGFSLVELVVVLALSAVLAAAAVPSLGQAVQDARERRLQQQLLGDLRLAQSEARRRGQAVTVAPLPLLCDPPTASGNNWSCGWRVYVDDGDGNYDASMDTLVTESSNDALTPIASSRARLVYSPIGTTSDVQTFSFSHPGVNVKVAWVRLSASHEVN